MARKFTAGRQSDLGLNQEYHQLLMTLKYFNNGAIQPIQDKQAPIPLGAIWNDRSKGKNILKINKSNGNWDPAFEGYYHPANLLETPLNPTAGQIRINSEKDNLIEFYDENTNSWIAARAIQSNATNVLVDMHNNFMHMIPLKDMDTKDGQKTFLVPYEKAGKLFDNGTYIHSSDNSKYEVGSEVSVIYKTSSTKNAESWVHVNPNKLFKIEKRVVKVNKTGTDAYKIYGAFDSNSEFYALDSKGLGTLLLPSRAAMSDIDFIGFSQGIELVSERARAADFIYIMSYVFYDTARPGKLIKKEFTIGSKAEVHVGQLTKRPMLFLDGLYLEQSKYNYNSQTGNVMIDDTIINPMDMMAIVFKDVESEEKAINNITGPGNDTLVGTFSKAHKFTKPLAFVAGVMGTNIVSPEEIKFNDNSLTIKNFGPGVIDGPVKVMVVEAADMYLKHGTIDKTNSIKHDGITNNADDKYLLFADGVLVSSRDLEVLEGEIIIANAVEGQQYVLLKIEHETSALSFDSKVMNFTVSIRNTDGTLYNECDNATVYADGKLVAMEDAILKSALPIKGATGQIVKVKTPDVNNNSIYNYYIWNSNTAVWDKVKDDASIVKYEALIRATYSPGSVMIDSTNLQNKKGTYYAYTYANSVEEPLLKGHRTIKKGVTEYSVNVTHNFNTGQGAFSAYLDGILCPSIEESASTGKFRVPELIADKTTDPYEAQLTYYVERPEKTEIVSCIREVLTAANRTTEYENGYKTNISLIPGVVAMYANGVRLEKDDYSIINPNTFVLHQSIVGSQKNYDPKNRDTWNKYMVYDKTGKYEIQCYRPDEIVVEVREDYDLKTQTIPVRYSGQRSFYMGDDGIPKSLILTQDLVKIYIDGVLYDGEYIINRDNGSIILLDPQLEYIMNVDPIARYFDLYPDKHDEYIKVHGSAYIAKPRTNRITFEWR